ncbi:MAG: polyphosphate polymerase domain-containing protein [Kineothrix sp.]|nr:polyphosphate polymerase domain-containing protein [Kineothrix sp.]
MGRKMEYRHELKFQVTLMELEKIKYRLEPVLTYDSHQDGDFYTVRSLYFDDMYDSCLFENESGVGSRAKYRIRIYNGNLDLIHLEKKYKEQELTRKKREEISLEECQALILEGEMDGQGTLAKEFAYKMQSKGMGPKCIVEYDRCALVNEVGNVRVTFDMNIRGCAHPEIFLGDSPEYFDDAMPPNMHILEIKYDELLPRHILQAVDLNTLQRQAVSKYCLVRGRY